MVAEADRQAPAPVDVLRLLFNRYAPLPGPDRRVGGVRPPALRGRRPARRQLRRQPHLRPGPHRGRQSRRPHPGRGQPAGLRYRGRRRAWAKTRSTASRTPSAGWSRPGGRPAPRKASRSCAAASSSPSPTQPLCRPRCRRGRFCRACTATSRTSSPPTATKAPTSGACRPPTHPPRAVRPALQRLVEPGEVPAHARRAAPDGRRHPRAVGARRQQPADPAGHRAHRRRPCRSS